MYFHTLRRGEILHKKVLFSGACLFPQMLCLSNNCRGKQVVNKHIFLLIFFPNNTKILQTICI